VPVGQGYAVSLENLTFLINNYFNALPCANFYANVGMKFL